MKMPIPRVYFGTMTFGWSQTSSRVDEPIAVEMVQRFIRHNQNQGLHLHRIDTARIYAGGKTESLVGAVISQCRGSEQETLAVGTKAHPSQSGGLSPEGIQSQLDASLSSMGNLTSVEEFYLHQPDPEHSLRDSLVYLNSLVEKGVIKTVGMSNYHASEMERAFAICREENLTPPTVYQGLYNPLNRLVEKELLPLLKKNSCSFVAYNPLAAGLLTGKHHQEAAGDKVLNGRFRKNPNYLPRFYTPANFEAVELLRKACEKEGIGMVEATYRWLLCHSALASEPGSIENGLLLGASSLQQLDENLDACEAAAVKGPLPQSILQALEEGWNLTQNGAFPYWRSYSSDMPNRESLDQGASYEASKKK